MIEDEIAALWRFRRHLKTNRRQAPHKTAQILRTRAALDMLIAELTTLQDLNSRTPQGRLDLDQILEGN